MPHKSTITTWKLGGDHSVLAAKIFAIKKTHEIFLSQDFNNRIIFTDSKTSLQLGTGNKPTYVNEINRMRKMLYNSPTLQVKSYTKLKSIVV